MKKLLIATAVTTAVSATPAMAGILTIDDFFVADGPVVDMTVAAAGCVSGAPDGTGCFSSTLGGMVTGERDMFVELLSTDGGFAETTAIVFGGQFDFLTSPGEAAEFKLQWDGVDGSSALTTDGIVDDYTLAGANDTLTIDVLLADVTFDLYITTEWTGGGGGSNTAIISTLPTVGSTVTKSLNDALWGGTDWTTIDAFEIGGNFGGTSLSLDVSLDNIGTVPEPAPLALMGLGLLGMAFRLRQV